jgi:rare lipoprotein A
MHFRLAALTSVLLLAACATPPQFAPERTDRATFSQTGIASWYGRGHQGRRTASGERFNMNRLTAAHPTLPLDTVARVTNLSNNRTVKVRINDRGPVVRGRIIDLSRAAARRLDLEDDGIGRVRVEVFAADQLGRSAAAILPELAAAPVVTVASGPASVSDR